VEGPDMFGGRVDVVVTDGFVGNVVLKTVEGVGTAIQEILKSEFTSTPMRKLGALVAQKGLRALKRRLNPDAHGGAPILGLNGNVIKVHGSAKAIVFANAIRQTTTAFSTQLNQHIVSAIADANSRLQASGAPQSPNPIHA
jgi:phosphate acyltransferase